MTGMPLSLPLPSAEPREVGPNHMPNPLGLAFYRPIFSKHRRCLRDDIAGAQVVLAARGQGRGD